MEIIAAVAFPVGRGSVLNSYFHLSMELKLIELKYSNSCGHVPCTDYCTTVKSVFESGQQRGYAETYYN